MPSRKEKVFLYFKRQREIEWNDMKEVLRNITAENVGFGLLEEAKTTARFLARNPDSIDEVAEIAARNIKTYESETLEDNVASFYPYYINNFNGEKRLFRLPNTSREEDLASALIDPQERDGAVLSGFLRLEEQVIAVRQHGFFLWISPRGSAGTQGTFKNIYYPYHQIYMGERSGTHIQACALKSDIDESILAKWIESVSKGNVHLDTVDAKEFLNKPVVLQLGSQTHGFEKALFILKEILATGGSDRFYKDVSIDMLPGIIRKQKTKQEQEVTAIKRNIEQRLLLSQDDSMEQRIERVIGEQLLMLYHRYQDENGRVQLKGCAGGSISINTLLGGKPQGTSDIFSTEFRMREAVKLESSETCRECGGSSIDNHYHCLNPRCKKKYDDETNIPQEQRTKECTCGFRFNC